MRYSDTAFLIYYTYTPGKISDQEVTVRHEREVYINNYETSFNSQLLARNDQLKLAGRFEMRAVDYNNESEVRVDGVIYKILNVARRGDFLIISYGEVINND